MKKVLSVVLSMVIVSMAFTGCGKEKKMRQQVKWKRTTVLRKKRRAGKKETCLVYRADG
ncbi:MAG: hypothetical protein ACLRMZ_11925 [Blautia marasmi]